VRRSPESPQNSCPAGIRAAAIRPNDDGFGERVIGVGLYGRCQFEHFFLACIHPPLKNSGQAAGVPVVEIFITEYSERRD
jgi:hypothetical protein